MRDLPAARTEYNAAVVAAQAEESGPSGWTFHTRGHPNQDLALLYSNRAVRCDEDTDQEGAARDLAQAGAG